MKPIPLEWALLPCPLVSTLDNSQTKPFAASCAKFKKLILVESTRKRLFGFFLSYLSFPFSRFFESPRYARVDRRPLDPPPVVMLKLYEVIDASSEREITADDIQLLGLLCTVDLFPLIKSDSPSPSGSPTASSSVSSYHHHHHHHLRHHRKSSSSSSSGTTSSPRRYSPTRISYDSHGYTPGSSVQGLPLKSTAGNVHYSSTGYGQQSPPPDIVHRVGDIPITESSKMTDALVGATFVQPLFIDYEGSKTLVFVFSDLAVKNEGTFLLRYRMFDIYSRAQGHKDRVIQAECYGRPFRVYSTKEFPGLQASTELTKLISRYGVRLNIRETERKRRRKEGGGSSGGQRGKRKHDDMDDMDEYSVNEDE
jgi:hypothetical protein